MSVIWPWSPGTTCSPSRRMRTCCQNWAPRQIRLCGPMRRCRPSPSWPARHSSAWTTARAQGRRRRCAALRAAL